MKDAWVAFVREHLSSDLTYRIPSLMYTLYMPSEDVV
jgi:hypothetical protein